jgi:acyl-[acyl-carrier-protein]-phospholipid O-acyltransferase / long-chain-fatty-acid--[acyl-carrier-protein] ligase
MVNFYKPNKIITEGFDNISITNKSVFISNHVSNEDAAMLDNLLPKNVVFAIHENEKKHINDSLKNRAVIYYDFQKQEAFSKVREVISNSDPILLFPESKISHTGTLGKIYDEVSEFLLDIKAYIHPINIVGTDNENYYPQPYIKITLGEPFQFDLSDYENQENAKQKISKKLIDLFSDMRFKQTQKKNVNLFNELLESSKSIGEKKLIIEDLNASMTYKDLLLAIYVFQNKLKPLLKDEQVIGTFLPTAVGNVLTLFSLFKLGKTPALLNFSMGQKALMDCVETASVKVVLTSRAFIKAGELESSLEALKEKCEIIFLEDIKSDISTSDKIKGLSDYTLSKKSLSDNNEIILFTSGSENKPKGVILTHDNVFSNIHQALSAVDISPNDRIINALPMFHSFGLTAGTLLPLLTGTYLFQYPSPLHHKVIPELVYQKEGSIIFGTSTFFSMYGKNAHSYDFRTLRLAIAGAEKLNNEVYQLWLDRFGVRIYEGYGVTETAPIISLNTPLTYKKGTVGPMLPGMEYHLEKIEGIEEGGNLFVKGPNIMKGYLIHEKGFVPLEEWHNCGDIVKVDDEGFISIISRLKRFSKIGGEMVSLNLIEDLATEFYGSRVVAAVSIPDKRKGEKIILFSTKKDFLLKDFKKYIKTTKNSSLLAPKEMYLIDSIPLLGSGKTDYVSLQRQAVQISK